MSMCIDEPRQDHASTSVDRLELPDVEIAPDRRDKPIANDHRPILDDPKLAQLGSDPRPSRPRQSQNLRAVDNRELTHWLGLNSSS
jgi:hypothetical protein